VGQVAEPLRVLFRVEPKDSINGLALSGSQLFRVPLAHVQPDHPEQLAQFRKQLRRHRRLVRARQPFWPISPRVLLTRQLALI